MSKLAALSGTIGILAILSLTTFINSAFAITWGKVIGYNESTIRVLPADHSNENDSNLICDINSVNLTELLVKDMNGQVITETTANSQVMFEATVNHCNNLNNEPLLMAFEVRNPDENETTNYFAWQSRTANSSEQIVIGSTWLASSAPGEYTVIAFYMPCFSCRFYLNEALQHELMVVPEN